ncbi:MAG: hypothetical protein JW876_02980 [Candidatus Krumholzibacteriota bacterium]|nr:hypothetical protein [Candidatus Krumholzibacteriota bacterium]
MRPTAAAKVLFFCAVAVAVAAPAPASAAFPAVVDSTASFRWQAHLAERLRLREGSAPVPWTEDPGTACDSDRLALMAHGRRGELDLFLKGAAGCNPDAGGEGAFILDQGHVGWMGAGGAIRARCALRERVLRDSHRLFQVLSDDAPYVYGRAEGFALDVATGEAFRLSARRLVFRDEAAVVLDGGLPSFGGNGDDVATLRVEGRSRRVRLGFLAMESRRATSGMTVLYDGIRRRYGATGDRVLIGLDGSIDIAGLTVTAELFRSAAGRWDDIGGNFLGIDAEGGSFDSPGGFVGEEGAAAVEIDGIAVSAGGMGEIGAVPAWRVVGEGFRNDLGEMPRGIVESSVTSWWRHPTREAIAVVEAGELRPRAGGEGLLRASARLRARLRGGLDVTGGIAAAEGKRPWYVLSILDDGGRARTLATARVDDENGRARFSFLGAGWMNVGRALTARGTIYLARARHGYYSIGAEYRPDERFLFSIDYGTFDVFSATGMRIERSMLVDSSTPLPVSGERITIGARIWFGTL